MILRVCAAVIECRSADATCMSPQILHGTGDDEASSLQIPRRRVVTSHRPAGAAEAEQSTLCHGAEGQGPSVRADACLLREVAGSARQTPARRRAVVACALCARVGLSGVKPDDGSHGGSGALPCGISRCGGHFGNCSTRAQRLRPYLSAHVKRLVPIHPCSVQVHVGTGRLSGCRV
jgi:hypothetical protein